MIQVYNLLNLELKVKEVKLAKIYLAVLEQVLVQTLAQIRKEKLENLHRLCIREAGIRRSLFRILQLRRLLEEVVLEKFFLLRESKQKKSMR
jgi:methylase of polypeptide subunit release factors